MLLASPLRRTSLRVLFGLSLLWLIASRAGAGDPEPTTGDPDLRWIDPSSPDYRTPRAGEGFRTSLFGRDVTVQPRDRRSTIAWDLGVATWDPWPEDERLLPFGAIYFFRRPDEQSFLRGDVVGIYNNVVYTHALGPQTPFEGVLGFQSQTVPTDSAQWVDGERIKRQELLKGNIRGSIGIGYRRQVEAGFSGLRFHEGVDPHAPDNMFSVSATIEPEFLYFREGKDDPSNFNVPSDTFQLQAHVQLRWDALERNVIDLAHRGVAVGLDATQGWRESWHDWGIDSSEQAGDGRLPRLLQGYAVVATGVPGIENERHRLIGSFHGGVGGNLDRFSAPSVGGGPSGDEFLSLARPLVPGAGIGEFWPDHYASALLEYRYELFFFTYLSARASVSWLDRERFHDEDESRVHREDDTLTSLGARLTTGFVWRTRLQVDYNYNFDVIRNGDRGGNEIVLHVSRSF